MKMYEAKKEYKEYKEKDEMTYHLPEWFRILKECYLRTAYSNDSVDKTSLNKTSTEKNKKKGIGDLL